MNKLAIKKGECQFRINPHDEWRTVIGIRPRHELPTKVGGKRVCLDKHYLLEGGIAVPANNTTAERRRKK